MFPKTKNLKYSNKHEEVFYINSTIFPVISDFGIEFRYIGFLSTEEVNDQREFRKQVMNTYLEYRKKEESLNKQIDSLQSKLKHGQIDEYHSNLITELQEKNKSLKGQLAFYEKSNLDKKDATERRVDLAKEKLERMTELYTKANNKTEAIAREMKKVKDDNEVKKEEIFNQQQMIENQQKVIKELRGLLKEYE